MLEKSLIEAVKQILKYESHLCVIERRGANIKITHPSGLVMNKKRLLSGYDYVNDRTCRKLLYSIEYSIDGIILTEKEKASLKKIINEFEKKHTPKKQHHKSIRKDIIDYVSYMFGYE